MCGENIEIYYIFSSLFFSIFIIIIYRLFRRHATIADYSPTIPRLPCDYSAHMREVAREFAHSPGEGAPLVRAGGLAAGTPEGLKNGGADSGLLRSAAGRAISAVISRRHGICFYLRVCAIVGAIYALGIYRYTLSTNAACAHAEGAISRWDRKAPRERAETFGGTWLYSAAAGSQRSG